MRIPTAPPSPGPVDLAGIDLFDPWFHATGDPHRVWAHMRAHAPLHRQVLADGRSFWSVTRHEDACRVLGEHGSFTSERGNLLVQLGRDDPAAGRMLVATDPPRHAALRRPLSRMFAAGAVGARAESIREAARTVLAPAVHGDGSAWDLAQQATMLPMAVAGALLGLPEADWPALARWTAMAAAPDDPEYRLASTAATSAVAHHELFGYFAGQVAERGDTGSDDVIGQLMRARADATALTREEIVVNCYSLLLGANATTPHTAAGTVLALLEHPDQLRAVRADRSLIPGLVEEGLRWTSPATSFLRHAREDTALSGGVVPAGGAVAVWVGSANRDERVFADPYRFDVHRTGNRHIAFGFGPHYCLGAALARLTLRVFFEEVLATVEEFALAGEPRHLVSTFVAGLARLPVRTRLRATATRPLR